MVAESAPWISLSEELMIWISRIAMKAPRMALRMAIQSRRVGGGIGCAWAGAASVTQGDLDADRHAGAYRPAQGVLLVHGDLHRDALHHLGEVARGVIRRQQAELGTGGGEQAIDAPVHRLPTEGSEGQGHLLARGHALDLRFRDVPRLAEVLARHKGQQMVARLHVLADPHAALADRAW